MRLDIFAVRFQIHRQVRKFVGKAISRQFLMGISLLSPMLQTCQASNAGDNKFPGVCALFTGCCLPTFCEAVGALPDIRHPLERRQSRRYDHTH